MTHVICGLPAKNWDQLWNPTLSNRVWATFTFFYLKISCFTMHSNRLDIPNLPVPMGRDLGPYSITRFLGHFH